MANDIKLDHIGRGEPISRQTRQGVTNNNASAPTTSAESVTITNSLSALVDRVLAENNDKTNNQQRVVELKRQIENNQYKVDVDGLAAKLAHTLAPPNG